MKNIFIVIDAQNDFVTGALRNEDAIKAVPRLVEELKGALKRNDRIYVTQDTHFAKDTAECLAYFDSLEGQKLPVAHCIEGTKGWELIPEIKDLVEAAAQKQNKYVGNFPIEKNTFGSIGNNSLANAVFWDVRNMNAHFPEEEVTITLVGFCTDICVISNALILRAQLPNTRINVIADCCAGVTPELHDAALKVMASCQIDII